MTGLLTPASSHRARLRELLAAHRPLVLPGAYDALSARLVEAAGFEAVYMTGFGTTASLLGRPDVGLLGRVEMVDNARRMAAVLDVPLVADADTGYGDVVGVVQTVREYEQAGVAALHLEDQVSPKRCGHLAGKEVVPAAEMVAKVRAAVAARTDPDLVLIARTDAAQAEGLDAAIDRARRYADAGADVLFVEAPTSEADIEKVAVELAGHPLVFNAAEGGRTPALPLERLDQLGFAMVLYPIATLLVATRAIQALLDRVRDEGTPAAALAGAPCLADMAGLLGLGEVHELREHCATDA